MDNLLLNKLQEYKNPIVIVCLGSLIGATFYFQHIKEIYFYVFLFLLLLLSFILRKKKLLFLTLSIVIGFFYTTTHIELNKNKLNQFLEKELTYIGEIQSKSINNKFSKIYNLKLIKVLDKEKENLSNTVEVQGSKYEEYSVGDLVQITGKLKIPKSSILPGLYSKKKYLLTRNIYYTLEVEHGSLTYLDTPKKNKIIVFINKLREFLINKNKLFLSKSHAAIVNGIVFGGRASKLPQDIKEKIRNLGLSHITSASGFNVSILTIGIFTLFNLYRRNLKTLPVLFSIIAIVFYTALANFSPSIIRASCFITLVLIGSLVDKKIKVLPGVSLIILIFFFISPTNILDIGLQLSVLAFLGLDLFNSQAMNKNKGWLVNLLSQSFFAQIMVIPLIAYYFYNIQILGLISNIVAVPIASVILITGVINIFGNFIPIINYCLEIVLRTSAHLFLSWMDLLDIIQYKQIFLPSINFYILIVIYLLLMFFLTTSFIKTSKKKYFYILSGLAIALFTIHLVITTKDYLKIFFIPKYNHEAILVLTPEKKPIYYTTRKKGIDQSQITRFLRLSNYPTSYVWKPLKENVIIEFKDFSLQILENYDQKPLINANYIKLPMLRKNDPELSQVITKPPKAIIVNDYKRLSKKSLGDIKHLQSLPTKTFFLSKTGTLLVQTNGKTSTIMSLNE